MSRFAWLIRSLATLTLAVPLVIIRPGNASADHRHGWHGGHSRNHDGHWGGHHWRDHHWRGHHHRHRHRRHGGISGLFVFDFSPPSRQVIVAPPSVYGPPPPVFLQPPPVYVQPRQAYCREYTSTVLVNGRPVESFGTACLQPDGSWRIVSMN